MGNELGTNQWGAPTPEVAKLVESLRTAFVLNRNGRTRNARLEINNIIRKACPPLELVDVLALMHIRFARGAIAHILPEGPMHNGSANVCMTLAAEVMIHAAEDLCIRAELLPSAPMSTRDRFALFARAIETWDDEVFQPARKAVYQRKRDESASDRQMAMVTLRNTIEEKVGLRSDTEQMLWAAGKAEEALGYDNPSKASASARRGALNLAHYAVGDGLDAFFKEDGKMLLGWTQVKDAERKKIGLAGTLDAVQFRAEDEEGNLPSEDEVLDQDTPDAADLVSLRDLRDYCDARPDYGVLGECVGAFLETEIPAAVAGSGRIIADLVGLLGTIPRPELRAAAMYVWGTTSGLPGGWSRQRIAQDCGVTQEQLRREEQQARILLRSKGLIRAA